MTNTYQSLIEKFNLVDNEKLNNIKYINIDDKDTVIHYEHKNHDNEIIVFKNNNQIDNIELMLIGCYNSIYEIDNIDKLIIIDCRNNTFIIGKNVKTIIANDYGAKPRPEDDLISNNFKFYNDNLINIFKEI